MRNLLVALAAWGALSAGFPSGVLAEGQATLQVDYLRDVKPVLKAKCFACHGALKQEGGLRLDTAVLARKGGDSGPAVEPHHAATSLVLTRVKAMDPAERMPLDAPPLSPEQIAVLEAWVEQGAAAPLEEQPERDPREHWAFRPPVRPRIPSINHVPSGSASGELASSGRALRPGSRFSDDNPIDAFLGAALQAHGLTPHPTAAKATVLRRVYLDLIGLPPTPEELAAFMADDAPEAYERVVDRLLASPQYGERWGRHWMDIWRYSDWYGRRAVPDVWNSAPQIWRWRDWIVRSLNEDKGYDRMIQEMLAGDEIAPDDPQASLATGYLVRNWYALNPNDWMRANVEHTAKAFLGLTFNCAHCHDHKYDPISQDDYFRFRAFFEPIGIRQDRAPGEADPGPFQEYEYSALRKIQRLGAVRIFDKNPSAPTWFYTGGDERNRLSERGSIAPGVPAALGGESIRIEPIALPPRAWYPGLQPEIQQTVVDERRAALADSEAKLTAARAAGSHELKVKAAEADRTAREAELASVHARIAADRARYEEAPGDAEQLARDASRAERAAALQAAEAAVLAKELLLSAAKAKPEGDATHAPEIDAAGKQLAEARAARDKAQAALAEMQQAAYRPLSATYPHTSTGRRRALARWIASPHNPLTARVAVNHLWMRHFHAPLVATVFDFGRNGAAPTHPELMDWLAVEFMESGWSMKHLHRLMVTSDAYRRSSQIAGSGMRIAQSPKSSDPQSVDPENRLLWRMNTGRMEAEVLRDSLLYCAGRLDLHLGGQELENEQALTTRRRSLYYSCHPEGNGKSELGALFDAPDAGECYRRTRSIVPQQALALTNSQLANEVSGAVAQGVWNSLAEDGRAQPQAFVAAAFHRVLSRDPTDAETHACCEFLVQQARSAAKVDSVRAEVRARESLVRGLLNHNDMITIR
jgi:hypothetical protein